MRYSTLGRTGLFVSELCLGTMNLGTNLGKYAAAGGLDPRRAEAIPASVRRRHQAIECLRRLDLGAYTHWLAMPGVA
jgi:aryl-alcohol dehydrogenase-like predicted oxidoreductase